MPKSAGQSPRNWSSTSSKALDSAEPSGADSQSLSPRTGWLALKFRLDIPASVDNQWAFEWKHTGNSAARELIRVKVSIVPGGDPWR